MTVPFPARAVITLTALGALAPPTGAAPAPPDSLRTEAPTVIVYENPDTDSEADRRALEDRLWVDESELQYRLEDRQGKAIQLGFLAAYNRVDELALTLTERFENRRQLTPRVTLRETFSTGLEKWRYRFEFEQPLSRRHRLTIGAAAFDETTVFDDLRGRVGEAENTLASLFFREDFRHYYAAEGFEAFVTAGVSGRPELRVAYVDSRDEPLGATTNGSLFRPRSSFRDNPRADGGRRRAWNAVLTYDSERDRRGDGFAHRHELAFESAGGALGGAFDYDRWVYQAVLAQYLGPEQRLRFRVRAGSVAGGTLPVQNRFYLGGIGTLRAEDYARIEGERMYLVNLEYVFTIFWQLEGVIFEDLGAAWDRPLETRKTQPAFDAGFGIQNRTGTFRVNLARDLRAENAPLVATVRLNQPF